MTENRAEPTIREPFFRVSDFDRNPAQSVFDLIEWRFYGAAPKEVGIDGRAILDTDDLAVYIDYDIGDVRERSYSKFIRDGRWKDLVSKSYTNQNVLYTYIFLDKMPKSPTALLQTVYDYYAPQQYLRVFVAPKAVTLLREYGIDVDTITPDEAPVMDSPQPRHRGIVSAGYRGALRDRYPEPPSMSEVLKYLADRGVDFTALVIDLIRIVSWSTYFAQTEDAYVFGAIKEYMRRYGYGRRFEDYVRYAGGIRDKILG